MAPADEIRLLLEARAEALVARQAGTLGALLHDDFVSVNAGGRRFDKAGYIDTDCTSGRVAFRRQRFSELTVTPVVNFAVGTLSIDDEFIIDGRLVSGRYQSLCVFARRAGRWLWAGGQTMNAGVP